MNNESDARFAEIIAIFICVAALLRVNYVLPLHSYSHKALQYIHAYIVIWCHKATTSFFLKLSICCVNNKKHTYMHTTHTHTIKETAIKKWGGSVPAYNGN